MRPKSLALLLLALGCGLVASIGITRVMTKWNGEAEATAGDGKGIFVAAIDVGMGDVLTPAMLRQEDWPKDKTPAGAITQLKDIEGRRARARLYVGEPILENRLFAPGTSQQGASGMITKGFRIVPVKVDLVSGGSSLILPGDRVDVMVHLVRDQTRGIKETITRTILQDVKVFAVNDVLDVEKEKEGSKSINAKTISLLVTPKQASIVMLATQMGIVHLVMRSPDAEQQSENAEARPGELFGEPVKSPKDKDDEPAPPLVKQPVLPVAPTPVETPKPRPMWTIRVIKPNGVDEVKLEQEPANDSAEPVWKTVSSTGGAPNVPPPAKEPPSAAPPPIQGEPGPLVPEPGTQDL
jgi:pilus assembly protein CpaB